MKYIRTKDGIYEVVGFDEECIIPSILIKVKNNYLEERITHCCTDDIIKDADTIEELCDEFVINDKRNNVHYLMNYYDVIEEIYCSRIYEEDVVYGAIWTEWGLKYVAKIDDKGELELI